jgi:NAD+ kinase
MKPVKRVFLTGNNCSGIADTFEAAGFNLASTAEEAEVVVVSGGDGTILRAMDSMLGTGVPILGVNSGHLGFLADCELSSVKESMECLLSGDYMIDRLPVLETVCPGGAKVRALNEICINRGAEGGILHVEVRVDRRKVAIMASDGVMVSTPSGSTAYNLSCGGPVLHPNLPVVIITPICPHLLAIRPIVVPISSEISFQVIRATGRDPLILADGSAKCGAIAQGETITVVNSDLTCPVVRTGRRSDYYAMLGRKLGWGYRG